MEGKVRIGGGGELVPRADGEAVVAAVDAVADSNAELVRDRAGMLDREVRDAAARIELERFWKGIGRACGLARVATAAGVQVQRRVDRAEE